MECSAIYSVALARGVKAGAVLTVLWNVERSKQSLPDNIVQSSEKAIICAIDAMRNLIKSNN